MNFLKEMLSGSNGVVSSKRIIGALTMLVVLGCTIYMVIHEGCTQGVENIIQTLIISACGLLGITSIAGVWKESKTIVNNKKDG
jgi:ABC-type protease/lipase transport system fused ATPase/permease subunit